MAVTPAVSQESVGAQNPAYRPASHFFTPGPRRRDPKARAASPTLMTPLSTSSWRGRRWTLSLLLAALAMQAPFAVDAYLPGFAEIAASLQATPVQMQQTLSAYLLGFAAMNLFHGALSDSLGRRPLVLAGIGVFTLASAGCALAADFSQLLFFRVLQGMSAGAGMVVGRAVIRDVFAPADAQRAMSQVTIFFGVAPVLAPMIGGWMLALSGWRAIFWLLAAVGVLIGVASWKMLPESLPKAQRHPLAVGSLMQGYRQLLGHGRFMALLAASAVPFNGFFLYVLSAPVYLGEHLGLRPSQFFWFFAVNMLGLMIGAGLSGRLAGRVAPRTQARLGYTLMGLAVAVNVALCAAWRPDPAWSMWPIGFYCMGWSLATPVVTLLALDQVPQRRGTASSLQSCLGSTLNAVVAGAVVPLVMHSTLALAAASAVMWLLGFVAWQGVRRRVT